MRATLVATGLYFVSTVASAGQSESHSDGTPGAQADRHAQPRTGPCAEGDDTRDVCDERDIFFMPGVTAGG
ncbi:MAG TPA: hypothetical protein PKD61_13560, partial [Polyangiaceae bacterium]|nr:hypothetical protein [Polyangiaceae bacterium]